MSNSIGERLGRIDEKLSSIADDMREFKELVREGYKDHEKRLRIVEHRQWTWGGGLAILTLGVPYIMKKLFGG